MTCSGLEARQVRPEIETTSIKIHTGGEGEGETEREREREREVKKKNEIHLTSSVKMTKSFAYKTNDKSLTSKGTLTYLIKAKFLLGVLVSFNSVS